MTSASTAFLSLPNPPVGDHSLTAALFPGHADHRVAKTADGYAVVLIRTRDAARRLRSVPVRTEYLRVAYSSPYKVRYASGDSGEEVFTALTCLNEEPSFVRYFFNVVGSLLDSVGAKPTAEQLDSVIRTFVQLFSALTLPAAKSVQGVWAELFVIATSRDKPLAAKAWHATPDDRYDFMRGQERVEVKSSGRRERRHHFSLEQLQPPSGARLWIASLFTERAAGGSSLEAVLDEACSGISTADAARVRRVAAEVLGAGFANALDAAFDLQLASESLRYFDYTVVPRPTLPLSPKVSEVRFLADLADVQSVARVDDSALLLALPEITLNF